MNFFLLIMSSLYSFLIRSFPAFYLILFYIRQSADHTGAGVGLQTRQCLRNIRCNRSNSSFIRIWRDTPGILGQLFFFCYFTSFLSISYDLSLNYLHYFLINFHFLIFDLFDCYRSDIIWLKNMFIFSHFLPFLLLYFSTMKSLTRPLNFSYFMIIFPLLSLCFSGFLSNERCMGWCVHAEADRKPEKHNDRSGKIIIK